jgi:hypothetical protein
LKLMSKMDSLERKKYMGKCRWESEVMAWMMCRFPSTTIRYMDKNSLYMRVWRSFCSENLRGRNSEIIVQFFGSWWCVWPSEKRKCLWQILISGLFCYIIITFLISTSCPCQSFLEYIL